MTKQEFTTAEAMQIGKSIGVDFNKIDPEQFKMGLSVELEHGLGDPDTNVTDSNLKITGKIAWAHLKEFSDYYTRLAKMEAEAKR